MRLEGSPDWTLTLASTDPPGKNSGMDQERLDYADSIPTAPRRPWTLVQIAVLVVIVLLCLPLTFVALFAAALILSGGMQHSTDQHTRPPVARLSNE